MSSLTDLRSTLDRHAEAVTDTETTVRLTAIHHRVAVVRRRRRATGAGAAALVVLAGVTAFVLPKGSSDAPPAAPVILGERAPTTEKALGYTYRTDGHGSSFLLSGSVDVPKSDDPLLYSWTTSMNTRISLRLPDNEVWHSDESHFQDFVVIPPGEGGRMTVSAEHGSVGLASYRLTDAIPRDALSKDGIVFRRQVGLSRLMQGIITDPGQTEVTSQVDNVGRMTVHLVCRGLPPGYLVHVGVGPHESGPIAGSPSCDDADAFDPASSAASYTESLRHKGGSILPVRIWVTTKADESTVVSSGAIPDLQVGLALYGPDPGARIGGALVSRYLEHGGHTWVFSHGTEGRTGSTGRTLTSQAADVDQVAQVGFRTVGMTRIDFRAGTWHSAGTFGNSPAMRPGAGALGGLWAPAGETVQVRMPQGSGRFGVALYERTDQVGR